MTVARALAAWAALCATGCATVVPTQDLQERLHVEPSVTRCRDIEQTLIGKFAPTVQVRFATPSTLAAMPPGAAATLARRAVFLHVESSSRVVEDIDARVDVGLEQDGQPIPLILPREHVLAALAGYQQDGTVVRDEDSLRFTAVREDPGVLRSLADGIQTGYALFIVPFVLTTTLAGRDMPTIDRSSDSGGGSLARAPFNEFTPLSRALERGGCSLAPGGGCSRWLVIARPADERHAPITLSFAVRWSRRDSALVRVDLPVGSSVETRVRRVFSPTSEQPVFELPGARYTSACERRSR